MTNNKIPKIIYQSWKTKDIKGKMLDAVNTVKNLNPDYEYKFYDDEDCRKFLLDNFGKPYLIAFDNLIPGAFKCDLWRYAVLYMYGGVYMDIDMIPLVSFNEIIDDEDEFVSVVDIPKYNGENAIFQALIACTPKHPIIYHALKLSFYNIITKREDIFETKFHISGPVMFGQCINIYWDKDSSEKILPNKYGNINLNYKLLNTADFIVRNSDQKKVIQNRYETYTRVGDYEISNIYKTNKPYNIRNKIKYVLLFVITIIILLLISVFIYKIKYQNCKSKCSTL
jgi:hypothetical protein